LLGLIVPLHLLFPLFSSIVFVVGMIYAKNAIARGSSPWTGTFLANFWLAVSWGIFALITGRFLPVAVWWQAALVAASFVLGQVLTYLAYKHGDVSVATPIFGVKVIMVALMVSAWANEEIPGRVWIGAVLATVGVGFVQSGTRSPTATAQHDLRKTILTIVLALGAAVCMSLFDVGLQAWVFRQPNPAVLATKFLPTVFVATGLFSCAVLPWADRPSRLASLGTTKPIVIGTLLMAANALSMSWSLSAYGDATRINIVYALRGLWAVALAWALARFFGGQESHHSARVMLLRLFGAALLTASVLVALMGK
jgi:drug/metabolite transporter (DMT)-like permease